MIIEDRGRKKFLGYKVVQEYTGWSFDTPDLNHYLTDVIQALQSYCKGAQNVPQMIRQIIYMYLLDIFTLNDDRNMRNWGLLYDASSSSYRLTPIHDNSTILNLSSTEEDIKRGYSTIFRSSIGDNEARLRYSKDSQTDMEDFQQFYETYKEDDDIKSFIDRLLQIDIGQAISNIENRTGNHFPEFLIEWITTALERRKLEMLEAMSRATKAGKIKGNEFLASLRQEVQEPDVGMTVKKSQRPKPRTDSTEGKINEGK